MVENSKDLEDFISSIGDNDDLFLHPILSDIKTHPSANKISLLF